MVLLSGTFLRTKKMLPIAFATLLPNVELSSEDIVYLLIYQTDKELSN